MSELEKGEIESEYIPWYRRSQPKRQITKAIHKQVSHLP
jgi:hypothetical protein